MKADLVLKNALVYTVDSNRSLAQAIAVANKRIIVVGSNEDVEHCIQPDTVVVDLGGKVVLPAFVDSHMHPAHGAYLYQYQLSLFNIVGTDQIHAYLDAIRDFAALHSDSEWILGGGYLRSVFDVVGPRKEWLDMIDAQRPIALISKDGHSMWVNSKALDLAGITKDTPQPDEGVIKHDPETGEPSGLLQEPGAMNLVSCLFPKPTKEHLKEALLWLQEWLNTKGITTVHDAMVGFDEHYLYEAYDELAQEGKMTVRYRASWTISPDGDVLAQVVKSRSLASKFLHPHFKAHSFKFFADHVIEEETGYLLEPYAHREDDWHGIKVWDENILRHAFSEVDSANYQIHVHVIGDAAAKYILDALETLQELNGIRDARHSFAHLQLAKPDDIQRMAKIGISIHASPYWMKIDDYFWKLCLPYLGYERAFNQQYPFNSLFLAGVNVAIASDFYVSEPNPMTAIYYGMTRLMPQASFEKKDLAMNSRRISDPRIELRPDDIGILPPLEERVSLENMILALTLNGAYANFLDEDIGSIEVGKLADLVVLDQNIFEVDVEQIPEISIAMTIFEGKMVFRNLTS